MGLRRLIPPQAAIRRFLIFKARSEIPRNKKKKIENTVKSDLLKRRAM
jgi:hypothetical protein